MGCTQSGGFCSPQKVSPDAVQLIKPNAIEIQSQPVEFVKGGDELFKLSTKPKEEIKSNNKRSSKSQNKVKCENLDDEPQIKTKAKSSKNKVGVEKGLSLQLVNSASQPLLRHRLSQNTESPESNRTQMAQFTVSINSNQQLQSLISPPSSKPAQRYNQLDPMNMTKSSLKSIGGISEASTSQTGQNNNNNDVVFYESEYFYSTMPTSLPSNQFAQSPMVTIGEQQRPFTPVGKFENQNKLSIDVKSTYNLSQASSVVQLSQGSYQKLKIASLDLDDLILNYPKENVDTTQPKYLRFNLGEVYKRTGLPKPAKKVKDDEKDVFMAQNMFRVYKRFLLQVLEEYSNNLKKQSSAAGRYQELQVTQKEGNRAVLDCIEFVKKQPLLKPFYWNKLLSKVADQHALDCSKNNYISHKNKKGERPSHRMKKYGHVLFGGGQNIFNGSKSAIESVLALIIDDGVSSRGHRKNILQPAHRTIGIASEPHQQLGTIIVANYAFHFCHHKHAEPMKQIVDQWVNEDLQEIQKTMKSMGGDNFKYSITFEYPLLKKTTTIVKAQKDGTVVQIQSIVSHKNAEEILYNEKS